MNPKSRQILIRLAIVILIYFGLVFLAGRYGRIVLRPIQLFVTILHELGHAFGAVLSGGSVSTVQINPNGSGVTYTQGGNRAITIIGGYLGSALFGNTLFYLGVRAGKAARVALYIIGGLLILSAVIWYSTLFSTLILFVFGGALIGLGYKQWIMREVLMFLGFASLIYIIQDFNVGPSSDLAAYARHYKIIPAGLWMYIWLGIVLLMTALNIRMIIKRL